MSEQPRPGRAVPGAAPGEEPVTPAAPGDELGADVDERDDVTHRADPEDGPRHPEDDPGPDGDPRDGAGPVDTADTSDGGSADDREPEDEPGVAPARPAGEVPRAGGRARRRNRLAAPLIGLLCLLLGFAFAVQVRSTDTGTQTAGQREEDLVRILDNLNNQEDRLRQQIADQRAALDQLTSSDTQSAAALEEARSRAQAIGILNGTVAAQGPGLRMTIRDPGEAVRVADLLDVIEELRGAGAETMQIDGVRVGVSTAVTGAPGTLALDGRGLKPPYEVLVIGSPQDLETAMKIPGGVVQRITGEGGSVDIAQEQQVVVDALRPLDSPQYASPKSGG